MKFSTPFTQLKLVALAALCATLLGSAEESATVDIDASVTIATTKDNRLLGGNIALWYTPDQLKQLENSSFYKQWNPGIIRIPGGSWSDEYYWNGNGVRDGDQFDLSKRDGRNWKVDYSDWKPGFRLDNEHHKDGTLNNFHGHTDILNLHKFAKKNSKDAMVTINAGMGNPQMAAEWVRWANKKMGFNVKYWEIGNELEGEWELGHITPDGSKMNAKKYAALYIEFVKAMKAVDPSIKIGGATNSSDSVVYVEELLKSAGDHVDFISFHTYPVDARIKEPRKVLNEAARISKATDKIKKWIQQYQPERADQIEIGVTEWHVQVHENENTCNILSGVWCCRFIGEMLKSGVTFANQWDTFSTTSHGGHGLFSDKSLENPRAPYWAMWLWSKHMGDKLVQSKVSGHKDIVSFATMDGDTPAIMLINQSADKAIHAKLTGFEHDFGSMITLSNNNYLWNHFTQVPVWSQTPTECNLDFTKDSSIKLPPLTATVIRLGEKVKKATPVQAGVARPDILLPKAQASDLTLDTHIILFNGDKDLPYSGEPVEVSITTEGPIKVDKKKFTTNKPTTHIHLTPTGAGEAKIILTAGNVKTVRTIKLEEVKNRKVTLWSFGTEQEIKTANGHFPSKVNESARRNENVMEVLFDNAMPKQGSDYALEINPLDNKMFDKMKISKKNIGGLFVQLEADDTLRNAPKSAALQMVLQSGGNHWIVLDEVPLHTLKRTAENEKNLELLTLEFHIKDPEILAVMAETYSVVFKVKSPKPLNGKLFIDDLGFILRK